MPVSVWLSRDTCNIHVLHLTCRDMCVSVWLSRTANKHVHSGNTHTHANKRTLSHAHTYKLIQNLSACLWRICMSINFMYVYTYVLHCIVLYCLVCMHVYIYKDTHGVHSDLHVYLESSRVWARLLKLSSASCTVSCSHLTNVSTEAEEASSSLVNVRPDSVSGVLKCDFGLIICFCIWFGSAICDFDFQHSKYQITLPKKIQK